SIRAPGTRSIPMARHTSFSLPTAPSPRGAIITAAPTRTGMRCVRSMLPAIGKRQGSAGTDRRARLGIRGRTPIGRLDGARVATAHCGALTPHLARESGSEKHVHAHGLGHTHAA